MVFQSQAGKTFQWKSSEYEELRTKNYDLGWSTVEADDDRMEKIGRSR